MAEMVLSSMVEQSLSRLLSLFSEEITLAWNLKDDLQDLQQSITMIRAVLQDAEEQQTKREPVRLWLKKLKQVAYDAEDLFDKLTYENLRLKFENKPEVRNPNLFSGVARFTRKSFVHVKTVHEVRNINKSLSKIKNDAMYFGLQVSYSANLISHIDLDRVTDSVIDSPVVGREADISAIVNLLSFSCNQQLFTIVPIVGMGGLGKTFVAKLVCHEVMVGRIFDVKMWICVSDNSSDQRILGEMLQCLCPSMGGLTNKDAIVTQLQKELERKKFLLVLDDVWGDASRWWNDLKARLLTIVKNNGSAILLTTRKEDIASIVETSHRHRYNLDGLSDDECWSIIKNRVVGHQGSPIPDDLELIGKEIARKCKGVPLAAKVLGGTLSGLKMKKEAWSSISKNKVLDASDEKDNVEAILRLSFDHLPSFLKPCFAYCSIFPKDFVIEKDEVIQLWMAEGFLEQCNGDVGDKYFSALVCNSFFQDVERDEYENIKSCKMHDLVHDLAISLSKSEVITFENNSSKADLSCIRRVNLNGQHARNLMSVCGRRLRTVFLLEKVVFDGLWKLKNLRTLKLKGTAILGLPSQIGEWRSLRYLDVSKTLIRAFPKSISKLYGLQTLRFLECQHLRDLPKESIKYLVNLKHIEFSMANQMPSGLGRLTSLERLPLFVVRSYRGGSIEELECLNELRGELSINNLEDVRDMEEAKKANLQAKQKITALIFSWSENRSCSNDEQVFEGLHPHPNIERIEINRYLGGQFPAWLSMMKVLGDGNSLRLLNNLVKLKLHRCLRAKQVPRLGCLPRLKYLDMQFMGGVEIIGNEFYDIDSGGGLSNTKRLFPSLKRFTLGEFERLVEWRAPEVDGSVAAIFPCLEELKICSCEVLTKIPMGHLSSLIKLDIDNCERLGYIFDEGQHFPRLKSLGITNSRFTRIPSALGSFPSLQELKIRDCGRLFSIPKTLGKLNSLISLEVCDCDNLNDFPGEVLGSLTQLKILKVGGLSSNLEDLTFLNPTHLSSSLHELSVVSSRATYLPFQIQLLTSLKSLEIKGYYRLKALPEWLGNLSSLESLLLEKCHNLVALPSATAMKGLSKLTLLRINNCQYLEESCVKGSGYNWCKISHIPKVDVV